MSDSIKTPRGEIIQVKTKEGSVTAKLTWDASFDRRLNAGASMAQKTVDSEVLRGCATRVPFRTGMLQKSGTLGTVVGSGQVRWITPYAKTVYYRKNLGSNGEAQRGGYWFERWKNAEGAALVAKIKKQVGGAI